MSAREPKKHLTAGIIFLFFGFAFRRISLLPLFDAIHHIAESLDSGDLLIAAAMIVLLNGGRAITLYLGWFLIGNGLALMRPSFYPFSWIVPGAMIPFTYLFIRSVDEGMTFHFGIPAILSIVSILTLRYLTRNISDWVYKSIALSLLVFSFQWLDVIPALTPYGAGWGELSISVKMAAHVLRREVFLNWTIGVIFGVFFLSGVLATELIVNYGARLSSLDLLRDREKKMAALREKSLRDRSILEMQLLVHDLKRPLTTIMGLADVVASGKGGERVRQYGAVIAEAGRSMEEMISELLHEDFRRSVTVESLLEYVFTQISPFPWRETVKLQADSHILNETLEVNLVRLSRAIVNLLDNAYRANSRSQGGAIMVVVSRCDGYVEISVLDQGQGFDVDRMTNSGWNSTGLGLEYVRMVAKKHGGFFLTRNLHEGGAKASLFIQKNIEKKEGDAR